MKLINLFSKRNNITKKQTNVHVLAKNVKQVNVQSVLIAKNASVNVNVIK